MESIKNLVSSVNMKFGTFDGGADVGVTVIVEQNDEIDFVKPQDYYITLEPLKMAKSLCYLGVVYNYDGFQMVITRKYAKHIVTYYIPTMMFVVAACASFLIPPTTSPDRMCLLVTLFLVLVTILNTVIGSTPSNPQGFTAVTIWIGNALLFVFIALLEYIIILFRIHMKLGQVGDENGGKSWVKDGPLGTWTRSLSYCFR